MFVDTNSPAEICSTVSKRKAKGTAKPMSPTPSAEFASTGASRGSKTTVRAPRAGNANTDGGLSAIATHYEDAAPPRPHHEEEIGRPLAAHQKATGAICAQHHL